MTVPVPDSVSHLIDSIRLQTDLITAMSTGGVGVILLTWSRMLGIHDDADFSDFRRPSWLGLPLLGFVGAIILGYVISGNITGFFYELTVGRDTQTGSVIESAAAQFTKDFHVFYDQGRLQLGLSLLSTVVLSAWFAFNVIARIRRGTTK